MLAVAVSQNGGQVFEQWRHSESEVTYIWFERWSIRAGWLHPAPSGDTRSPANQIPHWVQQFMSSKSTPILSNAIPAFELFMTSWEQLAVNNPRLKPWIGAVIYTPPQVLLDSLWTPGNVRATLRRWGNHSTSKGKSKENTLRKTLLGMTTMYARNAWEMTVQ